MTSISLPSVSELLGFKPARSVRDYRELLGNEKAPLIRSRRALDALLADEKRNPLSGLDDATVKEFVDSCCFSDRGFCGFDYGPIQDKLSFYKFRVLIGHFGMDLNVFDDYGDYKCTPPATCSPSTTQICVGDNCK